MDIWPSISPQFPDENNTIFVAQANCPGVMLDWAPGPIFSTYPWTTHLSKCTTELGFKPDRFTGEGDDTRIWLRSNDCTKLLVPGEDECPFCRAILDGKQIQALETRAEKAPAHTPHQYLTQSQLIDLLRAAIAEKNALQLKVNLISL
jgi:hypothetical protein